MSDDPTRFAPESASTPDAHEELPKIGDTVGGKYELEEVIGAGGMGVVVAARHTQLGERVAIKFLSPNAVRDKAAAARFLREARTAVKIKSEHVVRVLDVGSLGEGASPYIVMEYVQGRDLAQVLQAQGPLPVVDAVEHVLHACVAIAEAHVLGIVHRDLKPSNMLLTMRSDGEPLVKVLDFGVSKAVDAEARASGDARLTDTTAVFGSPAYMSPEQVRSAKNVDARTDVWSMGVILFELLTGALPFRAETTSGMLAAIAADEPVSLRGLRQDVPAELENVVMRALRKDISRRTQTIADLATELGPFARDGKALVERILRLASGANTASGRFSRPSSLPPLDGIAATEKPWTTARSSGAKMKRGIGAAALAATAVLAVGIVVFRMRGAPPVPGSSKAALDAPALPPPAPTSAPSLSAEARPLPPQEAPVVATPVVSAPVLTPSAAPAVSLSFRRPRPHGAPPPRAATVGPPASASVAPPPAVTPPPPVAPPAPDPSGTRQ